MIRQTMRIIAGKYKNRTITTPPGETTRPLLSRIRKSLFGILDPYMPGARVLDCYAGTGIIALEALSRGADFVLSIEQDGRAIDIAKRNHESICPEEKYRILRGDVLGMIPRLASVGERFDIVGVMPPFGEDLVNQTLAQLDQHPELLHPETVIFAQHEKDAEIQMKWNHFEQVRRKDYGRNVFDFFLPPEPEEASQG